MFVMAPLHFEAALLQNSMVEQLYSGVLVMFSKKCVASFKNEVL
jgi:hypothetical protein